MQPAPAHDGDRQGRPVWAPISQADPTWQAVPSPTSPPPEALAGLVERVTFHNADHGFCVLGVKAHGQRDLVTVVGHAANIATGEWVQMSGTWLNDRTHGLPRGIASCSKARFWTGGAAFKRQVAEEFIAGETLHALAKQHDISRQLIRIYISKFEAGALDDDVQAADLMQEYEAKIAALENSLAPMSPAKLCPPGGPG